MSQQVHEVTELDECECRRLLGTSSLGHLGFTEQALPMILPVHMAALGDEVVVATLSGSTTLSGTRGDVVVLEAEDYEPATREGWTVSVIGPSRLITDAAEIADLDRRGVAPRTVGEQPCYAAVRIGLVRGRRLTRRPAPEQREQPRNATDGEASGPRRAEGVSVSGRDRARQERRTR